MPNIIDELQVQGSHWVDFEDLFHTIKTNLNTLRHLVLRELDGYHHYIVDANFRDALSWWHKQGKFQN